MNQSIIEDMKTSEKRWTDGATGLSCLIKRNPSMGHLCGYVGVNKNHHLFGVGYDGFDINVHGGLTFADYWEGEGDVWWLGFDCAHAGDFIPGLDPVESLLQHSSRIYPYHSHYWTIAEVEAECTKLAGQLAALDAKS